MVQNGVHCVYEGSQAENNRHSTAQHALSIHHIQGAGVKIRYEEAMPPLIQSQ